MFLSRYLFEYICLNVSESVCLNMCTLNISICNATCSCPNFCSFSIIIINDFKQMGLSFQSGHGHVHIHMCCLFLVLLILNFIVMLGPYA